MRRTKYNEAGLRAETSDVDLEVGAAANGIYLDRNTLSNFRGRSAPHFNLPKSKVQAREILANIIHPGKRRSNLLVKRPFAWLANEVSQVNAL